MTEDVHSHSHSDGYDSAPGDQNAIDVVAGTEGYLLGMVLAVVLTGASFWAAQTHLIYAPGIPIALSALAVAQMGVHLVFFL
ncbi:MAG TPA: cytochrome C oxidase subunit IV family protein, partial [Rhizomicrobium sp.]|nr:cytochrome C oxidase subunit IV family protein [Rhizomicrobium sp.]